MEKKQTQKKILIAEDEIIIAMDIKKILENYNYKFCSIVSSGEEAIKKAAEEKPNLILMDIMLRGSINGLQAAEIISKEQKIPIIFLTGVDGKEAFRKMQARENFRYMSKPYDLETLRRSVEDSLYMNLTMPELNLNPNIFNSSFFKN